ncbi:MAG: NDP-sugar synthase [Acidobacteria bacterium]|nr:NDP-sugar synthase [Acidobacteriota bacterium]
MTPALPVMILAAGRGERMRPLTAVRAKPALPVLGLPLVARIVKHLAGQEVTDFAVNAWHAPESIDAACARAGLPPDRVAIFPERELMGTGGALAAPAARLAAGAYFLVHNGDTLLAAPVAALVDGASTASLGALLVRKGRDTRYNPVRVANGRFLGLGMARDGRESEATYLGVALLARAVLERVPRGRPSELFRDILLPAIADGGSLAVVLYDGPWIEFTSPARYRAHCCSLALAGSASIGGLIGGEAAVTRAGTPYGARFVLADGAALDPGAVLDGGVVLEAGARAGRGASITGSVLLEGAEAGPGSLLWQTVVMPGTRVPPGAAFRDGVVLPDPDDPAGRVRCIPFADLEGP